MVYWKRNPGLKPLVGGLQGSNLYCIYVGVSYTSAAWKICMRCLQIACVFMENCSYSCWILTKANYLVIQYTILNGNVEII